MADVVASDAPDFFRREGRQEFDALDWIAEPYLRCDSGEWVSFDYVEGVETSYLELRAVAYYKDNAIEIPAIKVADGCNVTQLLATTSGVYSFKKDGDLERFKSSYVDFIDNGQLTNEPRRGR